MKLNSLLSATLAVAAAGLAVAPQAHALLLWGNNASYSDVIEAFDPTTGAVVHQYSVGSGNGRGVVVVGTTLYYTQAGSGTLFTLDANTGVAGPSYNTGLTSLATIAYDGSNFWLGDYSGTNHAYHYNLSSNLVDKTISLSGCGGNCDGLEYFLQAGQPRLISNEGDLSGFYDVYDTNGNLLTSHFLGSGSGQTGIAFNGTDFYVSNIYGNSISIYDANGVFQSTLTLGPPLPTTGTGQRLLEDLSFDYSQVIPTPEPASLALLSAGMIGLGWARRRRG